MRNFTFKVIPVPPEPPRKNGGKVENTEDCPAPSKPYPPPPQAPMPYPPKPCPPPPESVLPAPPEAPLPTPPLYPPYTPPPSCPSPVLPTPPGVPLPCPPTYPPYPAPGLPTPPEMPAPYPPTYPPPPFRLAHAYVPWQYYNVVYSPAEALDKGTLFPELYQPQGEYGPCEGPQPCHSVFLRGGASYGS
ncbi:MAG: Spore coat associated protein (CotJA) [Peptococcaceae bacterium]|nr:Spore coat associated protein (CotJA) [Peptococcaceae bacterium]